MAVSPSRRQGAVHREVKEYNSAKDPWSYAAAKQENRYLLDIISRLKAHVNDSTFRDAVVSHPLHPKMGHLHLVEPGGSPHRTEALSPPMRFDHEARGFPVPPSDRETSRSPSLSRKYQKPSSYSTSPRRAVGRRRDRRDGQPDAAASRTASSVSSAYLSGVPNADRDNEALELLRRAEELHKKSNELYNQYH